MSKGRLLWHLFPSYLLITAVALLALGIYGSYSLRGFYYGHVADNLQVRAQLIQGQVIANLEKGDFEAIGNLCKETGKTTGTRITVILPDGKVIADSDEEPQLMKNHADRREFIEALEQGIGKSLRFSSTLGKKLMYVALPINNGRDNVVIIRTSLPVTAIDEQLSLIYTRIVWGFLFVVVIVAVISLIISRKLSKPIEQMTTIAAQFASGELNLRVPVQESGELADLGRAMNEMAEQLSDRIATITRQRNESEAILASMIEGVLAVDSTGDVVRANKAAVSLLDIDDENVQGRSVEEVVRNPQIQDFIEQILNGKKPPETDVFLQTDGGRYFQLQGARLAAGQTEAGAVIVLNDMTRMRRLESVRRDFVANVSHELKTPITSIKGFVETLLEGELKDPVQTERFLKIVAKHSDRLNAIIEDLLSLSRLEAESEQRKISFEKKPLKSVIDSSVELSRVKAEDKQIPINVSCPDTLEVQINAPLLEQAVLNLVDNAIKYSDSGSKVAITVESRDNEITISVTDHGCGIEKKHLSRLFERFYVVDKGRSRKLGGTGLGLAIVKHICQVHGGYVTADSSPGRGSTFTIHLPTEQSA